MSITILKYIRVVGADGAEFITPVPAHATKAQILEVVRAGNPPQSVLDELNSAAYEAALDNDNNVRQRILASPLANRTPAQIYTLVQNRVDGWASLTAAKADLREWLPLLLAEIAIRVQNDGNA